MKNQLELTFAGPKPIRGQIRGQRGIRQPNWWFQQMRQVVDRALDRSPRPRPRPEQIYFPLSRSV